MGNIKKWLFAQKENQTIKKDHLLILVLAGILLLVICIPVKPANKKVTEEINSNQSNKQIENSDGQGTETTKVSEIDETQAYIKSLEKKLETTLSYIDGAGAVKVMITLRSGTEQVVEKDIPRSSSSVSENDAQGGSRRTSEQDSTESTVYTTGSGGEKQPYIKKSIEPVVEGIIVVAQGGGNPTCCKNISDAIQALFGVEAHKIKVVKMKTK